MKTPHPLLANLRTASPCPAKWEDMTGDTRVRFCAQCRKNVYDLTTMTDTEVVTLIEQKEGNLCARFYERTDGRLLSGDCPVGAMHVARRLKGLAAAAVALFIVSFSVYASASRTDDRLPRARGRAQLAWDQTMVTVKGWLGIRQRPTLLLGSICVAPSRAMNYPLVTNGETNGVTIQVNPQ
jgi:hypothetical protein